MDNPQPSSYACRARRRFRDLMEVAAGPVGPVVKIKSVPAGNGGGFYKREPAA